MFQGYLVDSENIVSGTDSPGFITPTLDRRHSGKFCCDTVCYTYVLIYDNNYMYNACLSRLVKPIFFSIKLYKHVFFRRLQTVKKFKTLLTCQKVWVQIRPDILSGLIWVQTISNGYEQTTVIVTGRQRDT